MALLALDIRLQPAGSPVKTLGPALPLRLSFPTVDRALFPVRSFSCSLLGHAAFLCAILFLPAYLGFTASSRNQKLDLAEAEEARQIFYLPRIGGGSEGNGS